MATYSRPGVFINEVSLPQSIDSANNGASRGAFVGTFAKGPTADSTLITSWYEFGKTFGNLSDLYPASWALYAFFANGGRQVYVKRVVGAGAAAASVTLLDRAATPVPTLTISAANPGQWGNTLKAAVTSASALTFNLVISNEDGVVEQFADLSMSPTSSRYVVSYVNSTSSIVRVSSLNATTAAPNNQPAVDGQKLFISGTDGAVPTRAAYTAALATFDPITSPLLINNADAAYAFASGGTTAARSAAIALQGDVASYAEARGDAFAIIDPPAGLTAAEAIAYASEVKAAFAASGDGGNTATYYPWVAVPDQLSAATAATRILPPGPAAMGKFLETDATRGVFKSPAGFGTRIANAVALERSLTNAELDSLNTAAAPVNAIRNVPGAGIVIMGARTLNNTPGERYINVRRSMIFLKNELTNRSEFAVFENNSELLWNRIRTSLGNFLRDYWSQGGLRGSTPSQAFYVRCDASNNTPQQILSGTVNIEIGVAVEYPAEFIVISIGQITGSASA